MKQTTKRPTNQTKVKKPQGEGETKSSKRAQRQKEAKKNLIPINVGALNLLVGIGC